MKNLERARALAEKGLKYFQEGLFELAYPTRCVHCEEFGELLCDDCRASLKWIDQRFACPACGSPYGFLTCTECDDDLFCRGVIASFIFSGQAARMAASLKDEHELRLAPIIAAAMLCALEEASVWEAKDGGARIDLSQIDGISFVPATKEAQLRRGFDHMELVADELSAMTHIPVIDVLCRTSAKDQRELGKREREQNLKGSVCVVGDVWDLNILLIDDVLTTGASIRECSKCLLERGAKSVTAAVLARVF